MHYRTVMAPPLSSSPQYSTTAASPTTEGQQQLSKRRLRLPAGYSSSVGLARRYPQQQQQRHNRRQSKQTINYAAQAAYQASLDAFKRGDAYSKHKKNAETVRNVNLDCRARSKEDNKSSRTPP